MARSSSGRKLRATTLSGQLALLQIDVMANLASAQHALNELRNSITKWATGPGASAAGAAGRKLAGAMFAPIKQSMSTLGTVWKNSLSFGIAGGLGGGALGLGLAVKTAVDFESKMVAIQKVTGYTTEQTAALRKELDRIASSAKFAGVSMDDLFAMTLGGAKLGIGGEGDVAGLTKYAEALAMISISIDDMPIDDVAEELGAILIQFGKGADQALGLASAVDKLADSSAASAQGILDVANRAGAFGKAAGLTMEQVLGLSTALLNTKMGQEAAGTALGKIFESIATGGKDMAEMLGMDMDQFKGMDAMQKTMAVLKSLSEQKQGSAAFEWLKEMGISASRVKLALLMLQSQLGQVTTFTANANDETENATHIYESVALHAKTASAQLALMWNRIQLLADQIGQGLLPVLKGFSIGLGTLAQDAEGFLAAMAPQFEAWGEAIGTAFKALGNGLKDWESFKSAVGAVVKDLVSDVLGLFAALIADLGKLAAWGGTIVGQNFMYGMNIGITKFSEDPLGLKKKLFGYEPKMPDKPVAPDAPQLSTPGALGAFGSLNEENQKQFDDAKAKLNAAGGQGGPGEVGPPDQMKRGLQMMANAFGPMPSSDDTSARLARENMEALKNDPNEKAAQTSRERDELYRKQEEERLRAAGLLPEEAAAPKKKTKMEQLQEDYEKAVAEEIDAERAKRGNRGAGQLMGVEQFVSGLQQAALGEDDLQKKANDLLQKMHDAISGKTGLNGLLTEIRDEYKKSGGSPVGD